MSEPVRCRCGVNLELFSNHTCPPPDSVPTPEPKRVHGYHIENPKPGQCPSCGSMDTRRQPLGYGVCNECECVWTGYKPPNVPSSPEPSLTPQEFAAMAEGAFDTPPTANPTPVGTQTATEMSGADGLTVREGTDNPPAGERPALSATELAREVCALLLDPESFDQEEAFEAGVASIAKALTQYAQQHSDRADEAEAQVSSAYTGVCPYCKGDRGGTMKARLENPYCAGCLHERLGKVKL